MSRQESVTGKLIQVDFNEGDTIETLCERICKQKGIEELDEYTQTWEQGLLESFNDEYIVLEGKLFQYKDITDEEDEQDFFCLYTIPGGYGFAVSYHNGGCCLPEAIEYAYVKFKIRNQIGPYENSNDVIITKEEYLRLMERSIRLEALEFCGVDSWLGYDVAMFKYRELRSALNGNNK